MRPRRPVLLRWMRHLWRPASQSVRTRLTLLYGFLFLMAGALLLATTYVLVAHGPWRASPVTPAAPSEPTPPQGPTPGRQPAEPDPPDPEPDSPVLGSWMQEQLDRQRDDDMRRLVLGSVVALGMMGGVSMLLGWLVAGRILRPLATMAATVRHISADNLHERLAARGPDDELKNLADTFDQLLERLESGFESQRQFVANASHELRTPLAYQRTLIEVALADPDADAASLRTACKGVLEAGSQQEQLIDALLLLARSQRGLDRRQELDLATLTDGAVRHREDAIATRRLRVTTELRPASLSGDVHLVERLVANLLDNAIGHNVPDGWIEMSTGPASGRTRLRVANSGPTIPADQVDPLFEPFRSAATDRTRASGLGLGLSIVAAITTAHAGTVDARALGQGGLTIEVTFPTSRPPPARPS